MRVIYNDCRYLDDYVDRLFDNFCYLDYLEYMFGNGLECWIVLKYVFVKII